MSVQISGARLFGDDDKRVGAVVRKVFRACFVDHKDVDVSVTFVLDLEMRALNRRWRGKDQPTDVLSFSYVDGGADEIGVGGDAASADILGDLVIAVETAERQAREHGHDVVVEVGVLVAHGLLHLCGLDHERDAEEAALQLSVEMNVLSEAKLPVAAALCGRGF